MAGRECIPTHRELLVLESEIIACRQCPRLVQYREEVAAVKRRAYREESYWGRPVPGWGDPQAQVLALGLAPAAHGGNRTGRTFIGDRSGDFLFRALYETGFASAPVSTDPQVLLRNLYLANTVRCAPPDNRPSPAEFQSCRQFLVREAALLTRLNVVVALGQLAFQSYLQTILDRDSAPGKIVRPFGHGLEYQLGPGKPVLLTAYHPSQQNTSTRRLTPIMLHDVFARARVLAQLTATNRS